MDYPLRIDLTTDLKFLEAMRQSTTGPPETSEELDVLTTTEFTSDFNDSFSNCSDCLSTNDYLNFTVSPPNLSSERAWWALLLIIFPLITAFGNILVVMSVYREKSLKSVTNYFIVSLAIADIMVGVFVMPFAVYNEVKMGIWEIGVIACDMYIATDVTASTASIFNLAAISIDRFIAVTQPIKYAKHKKSKRVPLTIILVWAISTAIGIPIATGLNMVEGRNEQLCVLYNSDFIIYSSISSFYIPCFIMVILYYKIFKVIRERARKAAESAKVMSRARNAGTIENSATAGAPDGPTKITDSSSEQERTPNVQGTSFVDDQTGSQNEGSDSEGDDISIRSELPPGGVDAQQSSPLHPQKDLVIPNNRSMDLMLPPQADGRRQPSNDSGYCAPTNVEITETTDMTETKFTETVTPNPTFLSPTNVSSTTDEKNNGTTKPSKQAKSKKNVTKFNFVKKGRGSKKRREKLAAKKERKATKTLAIVLGVFLLCWVPFFTCNIMNALCLKFGNDWQPPVFAFTFTTWIGYINSLLNPVIYTIFNQEFRRAFQKILKCQ